MTVLGRLLGGGEERAIKSEEYWGRWARGDDALPEGVSVTRDSAMQLSAVWGAVTLISDTIAALPLDTFVRREGVRRPFRPRPEWVDAPNREQSRYGFVQQLLMSLLLPGTAYVATIRNDLGEVLELIPADPQKVRPRRENGRVLYDVTSQRGEQETFTEFEMFHIPARNWPGQIAGISPLEAARRVIGTGLSAQEFAERYFGQGLHTAGIVEVPGDVTPEQARELKEDFQRKHSGLRRSHMPAVLTGGASWKAQSVTPEQAQFLESRKFSVAEIARWYRVPPHLISDVEKSTSWGTGIEEQNIGFVQHTLRPWLELIEQAITRHLLRPPAFARFNVDGLLRADFAKRTQGYALGRQWGWLSANDIHEKEDMPPIEGGDTYLVPMNLRPLDEEPPPSE